MTVISSIIPGGGGDYVSLTAWEAALSSPTEEQIAECDEGADMGEVVMNHNPNGVDLVIRAGTGFKFSEQTGWSTYHNPYAVRDSCAHILSGGAPAAGVTVEVDNVKVRGMVIVMRSAGGGDCVAVSGTPTGIEVSDSCLLADVASANGVDRKADATAGAETLTLFNLLVLECRRGIRTTDFDATITNCTIATQRNSVAFVSQYGVRVINTNRAPTVDIDDTIILGSDSADISTTGVVTVNKTNVATGDTTGTPAGLQSQNINELISSPEVTGKSGELVTDQRWPDASTWVMNFARGNVSLWTGSKTGFSVTTAETYEGQNSLVSNWDSSGFADAVNNPTVKSGFGRDLAGTVNDSYFIAIIFKLSSDFAMGSGEAALWCDLRDSTTVQGRCRVNESGGNIRIRFDDQSKVNTGTPQNITPGTWYALGIYYDHVVSGTAEWFFDTAANVVSSGFGTAIDTWSGDYSTEGQIDNFRFLRSGVDAGTSGEIFYSHIVVTGGSTANRGLYVDGVQGMGSDLTGNATYQGNDNGTLRGSVDYEDDTLSDNYIGCDEIPGAAPPAGDFPPHMNLLGVGA